MKYDVLKSKGVQIKGSTCRKIFINKDAAYDNVLKRIQDELYETTDRESTDNNYTSSYEQMLYFACFPKVLITTYLTVVVCQLLKMEKWSYITEMEPQKVMSGHSITGSLCQAYVTSHVPGYFVCRKP